MYYKNAIFLDFKNKKIFFISKREILVQCMHLYVKMYGFE